MSSEPKPRRSPQIRRERVRKQAEERRQPVPVTGSNDESFTSADLAEALCMAQETDAEAAHRSGDKPPPGSWADVARTMRAMFPDEDFDWDAWKDEMKEREAGHE